MADVWECDVCRYTGTPKLISDSKEEWGREVSIECPQCGSDYCNGTLQTRAKGECCSFCGEWTEEVYYASFGGYQDEKICKECEEGQWK